MVVILLPSGNSSNSTIAAQCLNSVELPGSVLTHKNATMRSQCTMMSELAMWVNEITHKGVGMGMHFLPSKASHTGVPPRWHRRVFMQACSASPPFSKKLPSWKATWMDGGFLMKSFTTGSFRSYFPFDACSLKTSSGTPCFRCPHMDWKCHGRVGKRLQVLHRERFPLSCLANNALWTC